MRLSWFGFPAIAALAAPFVGQNHARSDVQISPVPARQVEVRRIQAHFDSVLTELSTKDISGLTTVQRGRRAGVVEILRAYRSRGEFPHNYDFPGVAVPYFVDGKTGTLCAVAHLLESTGRRDIVDRIARADNNVWVEELAGDREVEAWVSANGITLAEAARIQVPYIGDPSPGVTTSRSTTYSPAAVGVLAGTAGASLYNIMRNPNGRGMPGTVVGIMTAAASIGMGAAAMGNPAAPRSVSTVSFITGGLSAAIATRGFLRNRHYVASQRSAENTRQVAVAPIVPVRGKNGAGVSVSVTF